MKDSFMDKYRAGSITNPIAAFDAEVEKWHAADTTLTVCEWLGMDRKTYARFVENKLKE